MSNYFGHDILTGCKSKKMCCREWDVCNLLTIFDIEGSAGEDDSRISLSFDVREFTSNSREDDSPSCLKPRPTESVSSIVTYIAWNMRASNVKVSLGRVEQTFSFDDEYQWCDKEPCQHWYYGDEGEVVCDGALGGPVQDVSTWNRQAADEELSPLVSLIQYLSHHLTKCIVAVATDRTVIASERPRADALEISEGGGYTRAQILAWKWGTRA